MSRSNLFLTNKRLAYKIAYSFAKKAQRRGIDFDDLEQEALFALWKTAGEYNPKRGKFSTIAHIGIKRHLLNYVDLYQFTAMSYNKEEGHAAMNYLSPEDRMLRELELNELHRIIQDSGLKENELLILSHYLNGKSLIEISRECRLGTYQNVQNRLSDAINKIKENVCRL